MAAYVIVELDVHDPESYADYLGPAKASVEAHGGRYVVRGGRTDSLEGQAPAGRVVVLEFADFESAQRWYHSAEYQAAASTRRAASSGRMFVVDGV